VLPFAVLLYASFLRFYVPPIGEYLADIKWTLLHYVRLFDYRFFGSYFVNTLIVALYAATLTMLVVSFSVGWWFAIHRLEQASSIAFVLAIPAYSSWPVLMFVGTHCMFG
jgi:ABC-type spermidine/putrescine transport system permease subunit I